MAGLISGLFGRKRRGGDYELADVYRDFRAKALGTDPKAIGLTPSNTSKRIWGLLMETGYPEAVSTLLAFADGTVSLYFSNGAGMIGLGQHEEPRAAARALLANAHRYLTEAKPAKDFPLPAEGSTRFHFLAFDGTFTAEATEDDLENERSPLSSLYYKAHEVISAARRLDEQRRAGPPPGASPSDDTTNMLKAATNGDSETLTRMLAGGIGPNVADNTGLTPLMAAAYSGKVDCVRVLLGAGAPADATDSQGYTALMFACKAGEGDCTVLLVEGGANVNRGDNDNSTPLMFAAQHAHNDIVRYLLGCGADPAFAGKHGLSAIGLAKQNGHTETEAILRRQAR